MVPLTVFLREELFLLTQLSQELPSLVRAERMPGPPLCCWLPEAVLLPKGDPVLVGAVSDIPTGVCERGAQHHQRVQDPGGRAGKGCERRSEEGWLGRRAGVPRAVSRSRPRFVSRVQERNEALDDFPGPKPENQVRFIYIQTCW